MRKEDSPARLKARRYEKKRLQRENQNRQFVAIDSEGGSFGLKIIEDDIKYQPHKSFLWGAGNIEGEVDWIYSKEKGLSSVEILDWLLSLADKFPKAILISFAFGYDVAQIVADLSYEKAWELQHGKPFGSDEPKNTRRYTHWKNYGLQYLKGKQFSVKHLKSKRSIRIYDTWGFFQTSFLKALKGIPGACTELEYNIVEKGKSERGLFDHNKIDEIKEYTRHELMLLCRMMQKIRTALAEHDMHPTSWHGAGSIAQALMKRENTKQHLGAMAASNIDVPQQWSHRAYFGGRIELIKQGSLRKSLYSYDISSAYPAACSQLSSMKDGEWKLVKNPSFTEVCTANALSMFHIKARFKDDLPFYPLPYRTRTGSILFPQQVNGYYMQAEAKTVVLHPQLLNRFEIDEAWIFHPATDEKPFTFIQTMFDYRASLPKDDITQIVIKLGINSVYGKLAQSVGQFRQPPALASVWHAAAITSWTRAKLFDAAMHNPDAIVMLATDGIVSTESLALDCPSKKTLGAWEASTMPDGGVFVQSGVYAYSTPKGEWKGKSRGFRPNNLDVSISEFLRDEVPQLWCTNSVQYKFPYTNCMTLGASVVSREKWVHCGQWMEATRDLDLVHAGIKRNITGNKRELISRCNHLINTWPNSILAVLEVDENGEQVLSYPSSPEWLDYDFGLRQREEDEQEQIEAGFS